MIERRTLVSAIAISSLALPGHRTHAQQRTKPIRIGILGNTTQEQTTALGYHPAFFDEMRRLGHVEGRDIAYEFVWAEGKPERLPALAAELVRRKVDIIFATAVPAARSISRPRRRSASRSLHPSWPWPTG